MRVRKLGVIGAGVMGRGIAGIAASAGVPVLLLDLPGKEDRNEVAKAGLKRALADRPPAFLDAGRAALVEVGNNEDDLARLVKCDWVVEAIPERPDLKRALYERLESATDSDTVITTNTSAIPMSVLVEGRSEGFRRRFFGTHFFNPVRLMHLLEVIPVPDSDPTAVEAITRFAERILGKGVVRTRDAPGFIANRLGIHGILQALRLMEAHGLSVGEVDALTGPLMGRPKSAIFRTSDIAGLDVLVDTAAGLARTTGEDFTVPQWMSRLVEDGRLGQKSGAGFYRKEDGTILALDPETDEYRPAKGIDAEEVTALGGEPLAKRLQGLLTAPEPYGPFCRAFLGTTFHYAAAHAPELAYDLPSVDRAMEWGYGWTRGPFQQMDALGADRLGQILSEQGLDVPELLDRGKDGFYWEEQGERIVVSFTGGHEPVEEVPGRIDLAAVRGARGVVDDNEHAALLDLGEGVGLLRFRSKMGTLGDGVVQMLRSATDRLEAEGWSGLVIGHDDPRAFSAGANLVEMLGAAKGRRWDALEQWIRGFQEVILGLRRAPFPVVSAPFGMTLAGGAELVLHTDQVQAHAELQMGLVEAGVGLIPAGGGTKELLFRFAAEVEAFSPTHLGSAVHRAFTLIARAETSMSALHARSLGFLQDRDRITMNRDRLLHDARSRVLDLAPDYVAPQERTMTAPGNRVIGDLRAEIRAMGEAGWASEHDELIGREIAYVLCGGDGGPRTVTEQDILDFEREAFLRLLGTEKTQERIRHTLETGKPLRN